MLLGLAAAYEPPLLGRLALVLGGAPRVQERALAGVPTTLFRPGRGEGPWPALVVVPGVTRAGRRHPAFVGIGRGLAVTGHVAAVVEPDGLALGELTPAVVERLADATRAAAALPEAQGGRVALVAVSGGATLALLVAARDDLAARVAAVTALAPCCDIPEAMRLVTTGVYRSGGVDARHPTGDFFKVVIARSAVAWLEEGRERDALRDALLALDDYGPDPLATLRAWPRDGLSLSAGAVVDLLANEDPARFDELFAALPPQLRRAAEALAPVLVAERILAPVELVVAREDKYIPAADARAFASRCQGARLTVLRSLAHAVPRLAPSAVADLLRLDGALVRLLATVRRPSYSRR